MSKGLAIEFAVSREAHMDTRWVTSATALPQEGQPVEFVLDGRAVAMGGIYVRRTFRSRWAGYEVERVHTWRSMNAGTDAKGSGPHANSGDACAGYRRDVFQDARPNGSAAGQRLPSVRVHR